MALPEADARLERRTVLAARGLRLAIGDAVTIGPVDFAVPAGAALGVVGETGSGKSLLCRGLIGMLPAVGGRIEGGSLTIDGEELARAPAADWARARRRAIGFVPQASLSGLDPVRRVGAQLTETLRVQGLSGRAARRAGALELLEQVRLRDPGRVLRSYPHQLSGGMRQRVMIALAIAGDPALLVADEPTTALDATVQGEILQLLRRVQRERGMAAIVVSHDMKVIRRTCDAVGVMYAGRFVEMGPTAEVLAHPQHPYTKALLGADPALVARGAPLEAIGGAPPPAARWRDPGCPFRARCAFAVERCAHDDPELEARGDGRRVACVHPAGVIDR